MVNVRLQKSLLSCDHQSGVPEIHGNSLCCLMSVAGEQGEYLCTIYSAKICWWTPGPWQPSGHSQFCVMSSWRGAEGHSLGSCFSARFSLILSPVPGVDALHLCPVTCSHHCHPHHPCLLCWSSPLCKGKDLLLTQPHRCMLGTNWHMLCANWCMFEWLWCCEYLSGGRIRTNLEWSEKAS